MRGEAVYPLGGCQSLRYGATARRLGSGVNLTGLCRCIDHAADDLTITVEAGMTFAEVSHILAERNQRLAWDVFDPKSATIGGILATAWSGPRRGRWGGVRESVVGMSVVDGTGRMIHSGGRVVKNAAGYDLGRLFCGTLGTFGIITEVTLAVRPMPETHAWVLCRHPFPARTEEIVSELIALQVTPSAMLVTLGEMASPDLTESEMSDEAVLAVALEGEASEIGWMLDETLGCLTRLGLSPHELLDTESEMQFRRFAAACAGGGGRTGIAVSGLPGDAVTTAQRFFRRPKPIGNDKGPDDVYEVAGESRTADGICDSLVFCPRTGDLRGVTSERPERVTRWLQQRRQETDSVAGGSPGSMRVTVADASPMKRETPENAAIDTGMGWSIASIWGNVSPDMPIFESLKTSFDPHGILNPGRYIFR